MSAADRLCCDGLCQQGSHCPALPQPRPHCPASALRLAPGVVDGPHRPAKPPYLRWMLRLVTKAGRP